MTTDTTTVTAVGTIKVAIVETDVFGLKAWHCKCLTCGWQSKRLGKNDAAIRLGQAHRCTRWGTR